MKHLALCAALCAAALLSSCGGSEPTVTVIKAVESIQCVTIPETIEQLDAALARAGVVPVAKSCASDGYDRAFACGVKVNYLRVIEIPNSQMSAASALGYQGPEAFPHMRPLEGCSN